METDEIIEEVNINNFEDTEENENISKEEKPLKFNALKPHQLNVHKYSFNIIFISIIFNKLYRKDQLKLEKYLFRLIDLCLSKITGWIYINQL